MTATNKARVTVFTGATVRGTFFDFETLQKLLGAIDIEAHCKALPDVKPEYMTIEYLTKLETDR